MGGTNVERSGRRSGHKGSIKGRRQREIDELLALDASMVMVNRDRRGSEKTGD
jgi:hypothetical protein